MALPVALQGPGPGQRRRPIRSKSVPELVIDRLIEMIASGDLPRGQRLPTEHELATELGVSIVALREATRVLKTLGVLGSAPRRGTVVLPDAGYAQFEQLGILMSLSERSTANVVEARAIVEGAAVRLAAMRATTEEVFELRRILGRQRQALHDVERFPVEDEIFHRTTVAAAHNPILLTVIDGIRQPVGVLRRQTALIPGRLDKALRYHSQLVDAIEAHDSDAAERVLLAHLEDITMDVKTRVESSEVKD